MKDRREMFAGKLGEGRRLVPADSSDRIVVLAFRIVTHLPGGRAGPIGPVGEERGRFGPLEGATVLHEWKAPQRPVGVAAAVDKALVSLVGDLVAIDVESLDPLGRKMVQT